MSDFYIKQGDTLKPIEAVLQDEIGPINLSSCTVRMIIRRVGATRVSALVRTCTLTDAANGRVTMNWQAGDTAKSGSFRAEFEITYPDTKKMTVPNNGWVSIVILPDLG